VDHADHADGDGKAREILQRHGDEEQQNEGQAFQKRNPSKSP
jgi:hypothetical protein